MNRDSLIDQLQQAHGALRTMKRMAKQMTRIAGDEAERVDGLIDALEDFTPPGGGEPPVIEPDPPTEPVDPIAEEEEQEPDPPQVEVGDEGRRVYTANGNSWKDDTGNVHPMSNGIQGLVGALNHAARQPDPVIVQLEGTAWLELCLNRPGTKGAVDVPEGMKLDAIVRGGALTSLKTSDRYLGGRSDHQNPPIARWEYQRGTLDLRQAGKYPIVTGLNSAAGVFGFKNLEVLTTGGSQSKVYSAIRGNAAAQYEVSDIRCGGTNEYVVYLNYGPGQSYVGRIVGHDNGRGIVQVCMRTTENYFAGAWASATDELLVHDITARDNGGKDGSSAVSIAGWGKGLIEVRRLDVNTHWNAGGLSLRYDIKQADVTGTPGNWQRVGPGFLLPSGKAHARVVADLATSTIVNGNDNPGQTHKSSREQVIIDSCDWLDYRPGTYGGKGPGDRVTNIGTRA